MPGMTGQVRSLKPCGRFIAAAHKRGFAMFLLTNYLSEQSFTLSYLFGALHPVNIRSPKAFLGILAAERIQRPFDPLQCNQWALFGGQNIHQRRHIPLLDKRQLLEAHVAQLHQALAFNANQVFQDVGLVGGHKNRVQGSGFRIP